MRSINVAVVLLVFGFAGRAQPLNQRVLLIHNSAFPDSTGVADYYAARRAIPAANRCPINSTSAVILTWDQYDVQVRQPVRACLNAAGRDKILYVVLSFQTPFKVSVPGALVYALDQYLADIWDAHATSHAEPWPEKIQPYYGKAQSEGGWYPDFETLASWRAKASSPDIYSVWRLDAANAALAKGLVDKAIQAETTGLTGRACFDRRLGAISSQYDAGYASAEWELFRAADFARRSGFSVLEDETSAEFGTAPAPARCDGAAMYAGWYSLNHYNDAFTWSPGAVGFHIDSASAVDPRGGTNWAANALLKGITVTTGAVAEPYLDGIPHPDVVFRSLLEGANAGDAILRGTQWLKWMLLNIGDPLYLPFPGGRPPFHAIPAEAALILSPFGVVGSTPVLGTIRLASAAPSGGTLVSLTSNRPEATVPASVTVLAGQRTKTFPITTAAVITDILLRIRAGFPGGELTNTLGVYPLLGGIRFDPTSTSAGLPVTGTVVLNANAGTGGAVVQLESDNPGIASAPATLLVPAGQDKATFALNSTPVTSNIVVRVTARHAEADATATVTVRPAIVSLALGSNNVTGNQRNLRVDLASPAATGTSIALTSSSPSIVSVPATLSVPAGATSVMVTVNNGTTSGSTTITARYRGDTKTIATTTVAPVLSSLYVQASALGGSTVTGTVTLNGVSAGPIAVSLSSNHAAATPPASVTVLAGSKTATFQLLTSPVANPTTVTITGTAGVVKTVTIVVNPPALQTLSVADASLVSGQTGSCTVTLTGNAPAGGAVVAISSTNSGVQTPASVTVSAGAKSAAFQFTARPVSSVTSGAISASFRGVTKSVSVTVSP